MTIIIVIITIMMMILLLIIDEKLGPLRIVVDSVARHTDRLIRSRRPSRMV